MQNLTLNLSLTINIGADGKATVAIDPQSTPISTPAVAVIKDETPKQVKELTKADMDEKAKVIKASEITEDTRKSMQDTFAQAEADAVAPKPVTAPVAPPVQPAPPPPPVQPAPQVESAPQEAPAIAPPPPPVQPTQAPAITPPPPLPQAGQMPPPPPVQPMQAPASQAGQMPPPPPVQPMQAPASQAGQMPPPPPPVGEVAGASNVTYDGAMPTAMQTPVEQPMDTATIVRTQNINAAAQALFGGHK